jgi:acyl-CoA synthetase (AMP-forming)/AMP-acid ligase II
MLDRPAHLGAITELESGETWSGEDLLAEVERRAALLAARGVGPCRRVLIVHGQTADFFADLLATFRVGATAAVLDPSLSAPELANVASFLGPALVLRAAGAPVPLEAPQLVCAEEESLEHTVPRTGASLDDPALVLFTSGTTGEPKGVVHSFRSLGARLALNRAHIGDATLARTLCLLPTHFGHGLIGNALTALYAGGHLFLGRFSSTLVDDLGVQIATRGIRFVSSVPAMWRMILERDSAPPTPGLERVHIGSAPLSAELWRAVVAWSGTREVVNMYGITEAANWIAGASAAEMEPVDGLIGRAWGGALAVRGEDGVLSARGEGELVVGSPTLMTGYLERQDLTREVLTGGWFRTGDFGTLDDEGCARLSGRIKNEINRGGVKIQPEDVDLVIERHPDAAEACTFALPDPVRGERVAAAVRPRPGAHLEPEALAEWCRERLRPHAVPERWFVVDEIPKTDRGKVKRELVREHCLCTDGDGRERERA